MIEIKEEKSLKKKSDGKEKSLERITERLDSKKQQTNKARREQLFWWRYLVEFLFHVPCDLKAPSGLKWFVSWIRSLTEQTIEQ